MKILIAQIISLFLITHKISGIRLSDFGSKLKYDVFHILFNYFQKNHKTNQFKIIFFIGVTIPLSYSDLI